MCGIAGFALARGDDPGIAEALLTALATRGPDSRAQGDHAGYRLVQTRLAIVDLTSRVSYPMPNEARDLWLLFNGEIYDHGLLRAELEDLGHRFATDCDAEVVLHGFEQWGMNVFPRLNGMFAVALANERTGEITIARDAVGIKPLVRLRGRRFAFASDALALVSAGLSAGEHDRDAIAEYGAFHYVPPPRTGIADVEQVAPGTAVTRSADGTERIVRWSPEPFTREEGATEDVPVEELERTLRNAVARQLVADVDVGIFLSSGVDSSLIATMAAREGARPHAFTIGFPGHGDYDELQGASELAQALGIPHHHESLDVGFAEAVEGVARAYDQPFGDSSAIATLALAKRSRQRVTVALSGTGGDDAFAGYYRHRAHRLQRLISAAPDPLLKRLSRLPVERGGERRGRMALARSYVARLARIGSEHGAQRYLALVGDMTSAAGIACLRQPPNPREARRAVADRLGGLELGRGDELREIQRFEFASYVPGDLLAKEDRATMAVGLEARVPLLDADMLALAQRMPDSQKASLWKGKLPLRELAARVAPTDASAKRRKRGFAVPLADLFDGAWGQEAIEWLGSASSDLVDEAETARLAFRRPSVASDLWALSTLIAWERRLAECRKRSKSIPKTSASAR